MKALRAIALLAAVGTGATCGGSTPTGPQPAAQIALSATPASLTPTVCPPSSCGPLQGQLEALATLAIRETGGIGGVVESATLTLRRNSDNLLLATATGTVTAVRFAAHQSVSVPVGVHYEQALGTGPATLTVAISGRDDNGRSVAATLAIPVAAFAQ